MQRSYGFPSNFASKLLHVESTLVLENSPNSWQYELVSRFLIEPIAITCRINFGAGKFTKFMAKISACIKIFN
jgi:hypothetical protein